MPTPKPHSKSRPKSKTAPRQGAQQGLPPRPKQTASPASIGAVVPPAAPVAGARPEEKAAPIFSQANKSLEVLAGAVHVAPREMSALVRMKADSPRENLSASPQNPSPSPENPSPSSHFEAPDSGEATTSLSAHTLFLPQGSGVLPSQVVREARDSRGPQPERVSRRKVNRASVWIGASLALVVLVGGGAAGAYSNFASSEIIAPNVWISGVPVGGLTQAQARERLASHVGAPRVALQCGEQSLSMPVEQLGARVDVLPPIRSAYAIGRAGSLPSKLLCVYHAGDDEKRLPLAIKWDGAQMRKTLRKINDQIEVAPTNARLVAGADGLEVVPDQAGRRLDMDAAARVLKKSWRLGTPSVSLPMREVPAKVSARSLDGYDVQLAVYPTHFNPGVEGRTENIRIACRAIQNHVLMPGETFSFNGCTGERTARKGYQMAHIFMRMPGADDPEVVEGLAGGVCQVSSTLFNAVRKAGTKARRGPLKIVERNTHSLPVTYVPSGLDATVAWPGKDFKFRNVSSNPVYIRTQMGRSKLAISIWSRVPRA